MHPGPQALVEPSPGRRPACVWGCPGFCCACLWGPARAPARARLLWSVSDKYSAGVYVHFSQTGQRQVSRLISGASGVQGLDRCPLPDTDFACVMQMWDTPGHLCGSLSFETRREPCTTLSGLIHDHEDTAGHLQGRAHGRLGWGWARQALSDPVVAAVWGPP